MVAFFLITLPELRSSDLRLPAAKTINYDAKELRLAIRVQQRQIAGMLAIRLDTDTEKRLDRLAKLTGRTKTFYAREAILEHLEDLEDTYLATQRLQRPVKTFSAGHVDSDHEPRLAFQGLQLVEVAVEKPCPGRHHGERRVDRHFAARDGTDVPGMAHHGTRISRLDVRHDFPDHSVACFVLRADHDFQAGSQPGHPVFRSLDRRADSDAPDLALRMAASALHGSLQ